MNQQDIDALLRDAKTRGEELHEEADALILNAVQSARDADWSYADIAERLGTTRQAAWERFSKKVTS